jgi:uncharacterized membrane protein YeaQ/YmgE (transglycosylase-associated protein family)
MVVGLWIAFAVLVGGIAALLSPAARHPRAIAATIALAIIGSLLGGYGGRAVGLYSSISSTGGIVMSVVGAIVLLSVYNALFARRTVLD